MKVALSILIKNFSLKLKPGTVVKRKIIVTMKPDPGVPMIISVRK